MGNNLSFSSIQAIYQIELDHGLIKLASGPRDEGMKRMMTETYLSSENEKTTRMKAKKIRVHYILLRSKRH